MKDRTVRPGEGFLHWWWRTDRLGMVATFFAPLLLAAILTFRLAL